MKRYVAAFAALCALICASPTLALTPPNVWGPQTGVAVIYNSDGTVCNFKSGGNCASSGGGGGAVTAAASSYALGAIVDLGTGASPGANTTNGYLKALNAALGAPIQATGGTVGIVAGAAIIGKVGIDQTTPGTTNGVQDAADGSTGSAVPSKASFIGANSSGNLTGLIQADTSASISVSTATTTQLVALSSGKKIYITAWDIFVAGADNITLEYGTGSTCGTGTTVLTGAYNFLANQGIARGSGLGVLLVVPASNALCIVTSAAVQASGSLAYTQF